MQRIPTRFRALFQRAASSRPDRYRGRRGQALVELALVLPVLLVLFGSALDLGRLYYSQITINNAAKEGALEAARDTENLAEFDSTQDCDADTNRVICLIINEAKGSLITIEPSDVALACDPSPCPTDATIGETVEITVSSDFFLVSPLLSVFFGGQTIPISSSAVAQIGVDPHPGFVSTPGPTPTPTPTPTPAPTPAPTPTPTESPTPTPAGSPTPTPTPVPCLAPAVSDPITISPGNGRSANHPSGGTTFTMTAPTPTPQAGCTFTYSWNFGDAILGTGESVTHLYANAGSGPSNTFTVYLVISTASGPSTTLTNTVRVTS